jgi:hypothetical protein
MTAKSLPLADTLSAVEAFIKRFVVLSDDQAVALTLWVVHTHMLDAAECTPYLHITSATAEAGKTRLLEVLELLVACPWFTGRTTTAALVRKVNDERPTLLLDESDAAFGGDKEYGEVLRGVLNTGYRGSGRSTLCVGQGAKLTARDFSTFSPKAIAGIGKLPDTVASRSVRIELKRRVKGELIEKFHERDARAQAQPLRAALEHWRYANVDVLRRARPPMPSGLRDRAEDVVEPLLAIADLAGGPWGDRARRAIVALMGGPTESDTKIELLHDIFEIFEETGASFISSTELASRLGQRESRPWSDWRNGKPITTRAVADLLKPLGIVPKPNEQATARGYHRDRFEDMWKRYPPPKPSNRQQANETGPEPAITNRQTASSVDTSELPKTPIDSASSDGLTVYGPARREVVERLMELEGRGFTFQMDPGGKFHVKPFNELAPADIAFLRQYRDEASHTLMHCFHERESVTAGSLIRD